MKSSFRLRHSQARTVTWLVVSLGFLFCFSLAFMLLTQPVYADSGGFPTNTPNPTATEIILPTQPPTATATLILLPTQETTNLENSADQKSLEEPAESSAGSKSLAQVEPNQLEQPAQNSEGSGSGSLFLIGLLIGLVILGIGGLVYWLLRRTGVIT
jgi:hypothetical protein